MARQMGPEEKLKCEFLLLKAHYHLEDVFLNIPHENYVEKASKCLEKLSMLDEIKKSLIQGDYPKVGDFFLNMFRIFEDPSCNDSDLTKEEFKNNFEKVFATRKTNQNSLLMLRTLLLPWKIPLSGRFLTPQLL